MRVLVTGSSGLLGRAVIDRLRARFEVIGLDRVGGVATDMIGGVEDRALVSQAMRGVETVAHIASLHAPHVGLVEQQAFIDVNVTGTRNLLQAAADQGVSRFVYTSTTSVYGFALLPTDRAVWVTEDLVPRPRDIYDITKLAAEELCALFAREASLPVLCLRVARFFPEPPEIVAVHRLCRGVDLRDATTAHLLALEHRTMPFGVFNISARPPFEEYDVEELLVNAPDVIRRYYPAVDQVFAARQWRLPPTVDRVYVIDRAERALGYRPIHNFDAFLD